MLKRKPRIVQDVSEEALPPALSRLGELDPLVSEVTIIKGWVKKRV